MSAKGAKYDSHKIERKRVSKSFADPLYTWRTNAQIDVRADETGIPKETDKGQNYRDYVLATGETHAVWEMVACAFTIGGFELDWNLGGDDPAFRCAMFRSSGTPEITQSRAWIPTFRAKPLRVQRGCAL